MAFIEEFHKSTSNQTKRPHSTCTSGWKIVDRDGATVLQLDTYGSEARKDQGTVSQSIQLDRDRARELIAIIHQAFPGL
ncbi:hypothetical protein [Phycicoccus sp. 3266]|uniref:hypothetical protein n=1 Tax=Phycicoccus sp. 3266 TaxID=2817751 RepID=UPI00285BD631|nr:hypothetical protein [Phycicoccus sp. 3266]MDR6864471.1 hypothetical protein [Phycicoccus sp. 3266]